MSAAGRIALVRHADALARASWSAPDDQRPLTGKGERQAAALVAPLAALGPSRVLTSPARRCADTVAPFARATHLVLEDEHLLAEGNPPKLALATLLAALGGLPARPDAPRALVACSHGDVVDGIAAALAREGVVLRADGRSGTVVTETPKGARWELDVEDDVVTAGRLIGPPRGAR